LELASNLLQVGVQALLAFLVEIANVEHLAKAKHALLR